VINRNTAIYVVLTTLNLRAGNVRRGRKRGRSATILADLAQIFGQIENSNWKCSEKTNNLPKNLV
jgi:hypothetical protein